MRIKQVRNATLRLDYGGTRFLIDPYLAERTPTRALRGRSIATSETPELSL